MASQHRLFASTVATFVLMAAVEAFAQAPVTPYYSVELGRESTRELALKHLASLPPGEMLRAEQRKTGWYIRAGAYPDRAQAERAARTWVERGVKGARVLRIEHAAPWLAASATPVPAATPAAAVAVAPVAAPAPNRPEPEVASSDLTGLDLEQLMAMQVTGVTGRSATYAQSPAAVFVLTGDDIRRAGVRSIAEALRLVPGLQVYRSSAQGYTVTSRGLGADKLQVLVDGRSVYSPLTSTVFWDVLDTYLDDIARIEVIRGPGATVWGANAVNGVINIVTKAAGDTQGTDFFAGGGNEERAFGGFRTGGRLGDFGEARAYVQAREIDSSELANGKDSTDGMSKVQAGTRVDGSLGSLGALSVIGDVYRAREYSAAFPSGAVTDTEASGRDLGLRWTYSGSGGSETISSLYYDGYDRDAPTIFSESRDTFDFNLQHNMAASGRQRLTGGIGARVSHDVTGGPPLIVVWQPAERTTHTYSAFLQDEVALGDWSLLLGSKFEHNSFTGFEYEPSARLGWNMSPSVFTWAAISRATRTPNRVDHDIGITCTGANTPIAGCGSAGQVLGIGSPIDSEKLLAYEWGLRAEFTPTLIGDLSLFANDYKDLRSSETGLVFANGVDAHGYGGEATASWKPAEGLSLTGFYSYVLIDARADPGSTDTTTVATLENGTPQQTAGLRLGAQLRPTLSADGFLRYVDNVPAQNIPNYTELNLRLGWQATPVLEFSVVGENLLDAAHPETGASPATRAEIARSIFATLSWRLW